MDMARVVQHAPVVTYHQAIVVVVEVTIPQLPVICHLDQIQPKEIPILQALITLPQVPIFRPLHLPLYLTLNIIQLAHQAVVTIISQLDCVNVLY